MTSKNKPQAPDPIIARNRRARHDYFIEETIEAGVVLRGWEVKSLRSGKAQINESYVVLRRGEGWLVGCHISPLPQAADQPTNPTRSRKLLLHGKELAHLIGSTERKGYTLIPLSLYWKRGRAKLQIGLARGKQKHDQRQTIKQRDWDRERARLVRHSQIRGGGS